MKERTKELLTAIGLICLASAFFFAVFNIIAEKLEMRETTYQEQENIKRALMLIQERRTSELQGWRTEGNPEL
jgi:hypothetical protein